MVALGIFALVGSFGELMSMCPFRLTGIQRIEHGFKIVTMVVQFIMLTLWCDENLDIRRKHWRNWMYYSIATIITIDFVVLAASILQPLTDSILSHGETSSKTWDTVLLLGTSPFYKNFLSTSILYLVTKWSGEENRPVSGSCRETTINWQALFHSVRSDRCKIFVSILLTTSPLYTDFPLANSAFIIDSQIGHPERNSQFYFMYIAWQIFFWILLWSPVCLMKSWNLK